MRSQSARFGLSLGLHVLVLGGVLVVNPWQGPVAAPALPLIVDLVVAERREAEKKPPPQEAPLREAPPPRRYKPAQTPPQAQQPAGPTVPETSADPGGMIVILPEMPAPGPSGADMAAARTGVDPGVQKALAAMFCRRMKGAEREAADCEPPPAGDPFDRPPAIALLTPEEKKLRAIRMEQIAETAGYDNFLEWYVGHEQAIPAFMLDGIDNRIFLDRPDEATMAHDRLMRGDKMDWEDDIRRAHED